MFFVKVKEIAEAHLGEVIKNTVATVPAFISNTSNRRPDPLISPRVSV
jgi:molecular chaperone DnaK (HSP70)